MRESGHVYAMRLRLRFLYMSPLACGRQVRIGIAAAPCVAEATCLPDRQVQDRRRHILIY